MIDGKFNKYDKVKIINRGYYYSTANFFKKNHLNDEDFVVREYDIEPTKYTVLDSFYPPNDPDTKVYLIVSRKKQYVEIGEQGLEQFNQDPH